MFPEAIGESMLRTPHNISLGTLVTVLAACGTGGDSLSYVPHIDELPLVEYAEEVRIGSRDDPDVGFSRIAMVAVANDGTVYVLDSQAREVRVYGADGQRLGTRGRIGEGPGEFTRPASIGVIGDTLWVRDSGRSRISWFDGNGILIHQTRGTSLNVDTGVPTMMLTVALGDPRSDGLIGSVSSRSAIGGAAVQPFYVPIMRFDRQGAVVDTVRWDTIDVGPTVTVGGQALPLPYLAPQSPLRRQAGDVRVELHWGDGGTVLEALRLGALGDTIARSTIRYDPMPVPGHVRDSLLSIVEGVGDIFGVGAAELDAAMSSGLQLPSNRPPLRSARIATDGGVWIELNGSEQDSSTWLILDTDLAPLGRVVLPARATPVYVNGSDVWIVELDGVDVPWLARLRLM